MFKITLPLAAACVAAICSVPAGATVIASFTGATTADSSSLGANLTVFGQSFTVGGTGAFNDLAFSFLGVHGASQTGTPSALGTLAIYSVAKTGTPASGLAGDDTGLVARSTGVSGDAYQFAATATLTGGTQYFAYAYAFDPAAFHASFVGGNPYAGGNFSDGFSGNITSFSSSDAGFVLNGDAVSAAVPEPSAWALMLCGFGLLGTAIRRRPTHAIA